MGSRGKGSVVVGVPTGSLREAVDAVWIAAAEKLAVPVGRGGEAYVHWDGRRLRIADDEHLDEDDTVGQLVLHELCHALVQGEACFGVPDWGLDNTDERDAERERAAVRLQAHLTGAFGLRGALYPTTEVRLFFDALGADAFAPVEAGCSVLARQAAARGARGPFWPVLMEALVETARLLDVPLHESGVARASVAAQCGGCAWRSPGGSCRAAERRLRVAVVDAACARFVSALDCRSCAACCGPAFDCVDVGPREPFARRHRELLACDVEGRLSLRRDGAAVGRCPSLDGEGPYACRHYDERPRSCRDFTVGSANCALARRRVGLDV